MQCKDDFFSGRCGCSIGKLFDARLRTGNDVAITKTSCVGTGVGTGYIGGGPPVVIPIVLVCRIVYKQITSLKRLSRCQVNTTHLLIDQEVGIPSWRVHISRFKAVAYLGDPQASVGIFDTIEICRPLYARIGTLRHNLSTMIYRRITPFGGKPTLIDIACRILYDKRQIIRAVRIGEIPVISTDIKTIGPLRFTGISGLYLRIFFIILHGLYFDTIGIDHITRGCLGKGCSSGIIGDQPCGKLRTGRHHTVSSFITACYIVVMPILCRLSRITSSIIFIETSSCIIECQVVAVVFFAFGISTEVAVARRCCRIEVCYLIECSKDTVVTPCRTYGATVRHIILPRLHICKRYKKVEV